MRRTFAPIPNHILCNRDLSHGSKLCCARLIQYAGKKGNAFPKLSTLADELGMSVRAVQRFISELEFHALLEIKRRGRGQSNMYLMDESLLIHKFIHDTPEVACLNTPKVATLDVPEVAHPYKYIKDKFKKEIEEKTESHVYNFKMCR